MARPGDIPHRSTCAPTDSGPRWVGDPVDVVTGANVFSKRDFAIPGSVKLQWRRNYNHTWADEDRGLGPGFRHALDQWLCFDVDGPTYLGPEGEEVRFPPIGADGDAVSAGGFRLVRVSADEYRVQRHAQPTRTFRRVAGRQWPLASLAQHGAEVRVAYDEQERVDSLWIDEGRALRFEYDDRDHIWRIRLHARNREEPIQLIRYWYDDAGRLVRAQDAYKQVFSFEWDERNRLVKNVDASGYAFLFEYDAKNRCTASYGEDGLLSVQLTYRPEALETELLDANGASWLYQYDPAGNLIRVVDPYGGSTQYVYGEQGLDVEVDAAGRRTEYLRDAAGAPVAKRLPDGTVVPLPTQRGEPEKRPHRVPGCAVEWEYGDLAGDFGLPDAHELRGTLPTAIHAALVTSEHPWRGKVERIENEAGLLTREMLEDGRKRRYGYTARGKVRRLRDFDGSDYKLETKSWDLPAESVDPLGNTTHFDYSLTAELQEVIDPAGNTISYGYDLKDRLTTITRDTKLHDRYEYDASDNLVAKYDGEGRQLLELEYDGQGRLVRRELIGSDEHQFEYDDRGWVTRARTHLHDVRFAWDASRRRIRDERDGLGVTHRYAAGELVSTRVLGRFETEYHSVQGGTVVVDPSGGTHRLRCHGRGVFTRDLANGWSETAQYSPRGWCLAKLVCATENPEAAWVRRYEYTGEGDLTRVVDTERGVTHHTHDAAHRLVGTVHPDGNQDEYRYTKSGSLLNKPGLEEATVGHINQLRYADRHQFKYGARQHVERQRTPNGHELEYRYDARDQLVAVLWNGQAYWSAEYDAIGRRISKTVQGQTWRYWWDGDRLAAEERPDGQLRVYVYADPFAIVPMLFVDYDSVDADPASGRRYYLFTDQRGCPERVVDDGGTTVWEAYVEPYGTAHVQIGSDFYQPLRFPGHWWDAELALHYNRFRYYSPWLGRYLQVDPIGEGGGLNVYAYTARALVRVDVRGLNECDTDPPPQNESDEGQAGDRDDAARRVNAGAEAGDPQRANAGESAKYGETCEMRDRYRGEDDGRSEAFGERVVRYLSPEEQARREISVEDGILMQEGEPFDTGDTGGIYVMMPDGTIYASTEQYPGEFHHSSLAAGQDVAAAGEIEVVQGQVTQINAESGHYHPGDENTDQAVSELRERGATVDDRHVG